MQMQTVQTGSAHSNVPVMRALTAMGNTVPWPKSVERISTVLDFLKNASGQRMIVTLSVGVPVVMNRYCIMQQQSVKTLMSVRMELR